MKDILIYTTRGCGYCVIAKRALERRGIPYREIDITLTPQVRGELAARTGEYTVPQIFVDDVYIGQDDELVEMVEAGELDPDDPSPLPKAEGGADWDVAIVGAGNSGLAVAEHLAGRGRIAVFEHTPYIVGEARETDARRQKLEQAGVTFHRTEIFGLQAGEAVHTLITLEDPVTARAVVVATGARDRLPDIPGEERLTGKGVSRCAECDSPFFAGLDVALAGNGERAAHAAMTLAATARSVTLLCPEGGLSTSTATQRRLDTATGVTVEQDATVTSLHGDTHLTGITYVHGGQTKQRELSGLFIYLQGNRPATGFVDAAVPRRAGGAIAVSRTGETGITGLFAAGTAADPAPGPEQVAGAISRLLAN